MEELTELRQEILNGNYDAALSIVDDLDDMSRRSILRNIRSYLVQLLVHLIKNQLEQRLTNSWAASIRHSILEIQDINLMGNRRAFYVKPDDWLEQLEDVLEDALYSAATEVNAGQYRPFQLAAALDKDALFSVALKLLTKTHEYDRRLLSQHINQALQTLPGGEDWRQN